MNKLALVRVSLIALFAFAMGGCATVTRGTKDTLVIESDPVGADVQLSTGQSGKTPTSFKLKRGDPLVVTISKEGYEPVSVNVTPQVAGAGAAGMAGNVLLGGLVGAGVDAFSGAMKDLKPNPVTVKMVKIEAPVVAKSPDGNAVLVTKLQELKTAFETGLISAEEHERERSRVLSGNAAVHAASLPAPATAAPPREP